MAQQPGSPALLQSRLPEPGPSSYIQRKSASRVEPVPPAQLAVRASPLNWLGKGSLSCVAAVVAIESRLAERPPTGARPRGIRSRLAKTSSCCGPLRAAKLAGGSIGATPSAARAALMSASASAMHAEPSGALLQASSEPVLGGRLSLGSAAELALTESEVKLVALGAGPPRTAWWGRPVTIAAEAGALRTRRRRTAARAANAR